MKRNTTTSLTLIFSCSIFLFSVDAYSQTLGQFRAQVHLEGSNTSYYWKHMVADVSPTGDVVAAIHFSGRVRVGNHVVTDYRQGGGVTLARFSPNGTVRWIRRFAEEASSHRVTFESIFYLVATADGGVIVGAQIELPSGQDMQTVLARFSPDGHELWRLIPTVPGSASLRPAFGPAGQLIVAGNFRSGSYQLPGQPLWRSGRAWNAFIAEVNPATGAVVWARRFAGDSDYHAIAGDGSIIVAGHVGSLLRGPRDVFIARHDPQGRQIWRTRWGSTVTDDVTQGLQVFASGAATLVTNTYHSSNQSRSSRLLWFAPSGRLTAEEPLQSMDVQIALGPASDYVTVLVEQEGFQSNVNGRYPTSMSRRLRIIDYNENGTRLEEIELSGPSIAFFSRDNRLRQNGNVVTISGAAAQMHGDSFNVIEPYYFNVLAPHLATTQTPMQ